jgi:Domain of unknown function (DUF4160)
MPTVLRFSGLRVSIRTNDHGPAHVHVTGGGKEALFYLNCPDGPPALRENYRFTRAELNTILAELGKALGALCEEWRRIHGNI